MAIKMVDTHYPDIQGKLKDPMALGKAPDDWWVFGDILNRYQSWDRPFVIGLTAWHRQDGSGGQIYVDTGEAFTWFDRATMSEKLGPVGGPIGPSDGLAGMVIGSFLGAQMPMMPPAPKMPDIAVPVPKNGRPERRFESPGGYLDDVARETVAQGGGSWTGVRLVREVLVGETEQEAQERELSYRRRHAQEWETMGARLGGKAEYRLNAMLSRTVVRQYVIPDWQGEEVCLVVGATFSGRDTLCWYMAHDRGYETFVPTAFGRARRGGASWYEVDWELTRRFSGLCPSGEYDYDDFAQAVIETGLSASFSPALMRQMDDERRKLSQAGSEETQREIESMRRLNAEMRERSRQRDAISEWEDAQRRQRKLESDRRIRDGWSAVIRGVDRYVGPDGHMIEVSMRGPGYRAYYDPLSNTVLHTDVPPIGWQELPRWE